MHNKLLIFLFVFAFQHFIFGQVHRFYYEYEYIPDSTSKEDVKKDVMLLDIEKNGSKYYSYEKFVSDSLANESLKKQIQSGSKNISVNRNVKPGTVAFSVTKSYPEFTTDLHTGISTDLYMVREENKPEWKILPDKEKIGEWNAQKAETNFGGRHWIAWFTTEIPFQDGPYKFYGLPGLIVKIEDTSGSHRMILKGTKTFSILEQSEEAELPENFTSIGMNQKEIAATEAQFKKVWKAYKNDPAKNMREMMMKAGGGTSVQIRFKSDDGKEITDNQQAIRAIEQNAKENIKKNNNPIEPELYE